MTHFSGILSLSFLHVMYFCEGGALISSGGSMFGANVLSMLAVCRAFTNCLLLKFDPCPIKEAYKEKGKLNRNIISCIKQLRWPIHRVL